MISLSKQYVSAGDYQVVGEGDDKLLVGLLGTCVGVAIFDITAQVGGLCHILLPEPNDPSNVWQPKNYASTSMPLFVDALLQKGADRDRLQAVVAGGSLCAPFTNQDLRLDIGGRTGEVVLLFLARHNIPIQKAETGGCYSMNLSLNSSTWQAEINHIIASSAQPLPRKLHKIERQEIEEVMAKTKPIPQVALKLIRLLRSGEYDLGSITRELSNDQVLGAKVLGYCNSAYIGGSGTIDSLDRAVLLLGESNLLEAVISASLTDLFNEHPGGYSLHKGGLFRHSVGVANLSRIIAAHTGLIDEQIAYTAGLLHDIGKVVLDQYMGDFQQLFTRADPKKVTDFIEIESKAFSMDHQAIGGHLAARWQIPENLADAIAFHHQPEKAAKAPELTHAVYLADLLTSSFMAGMEIERINTANLDHRLSVLGLSPDQIPLLVDRMPWSRLMYL